jgi:GNAT superfamily N-acetyltransferase
MARKSAVKKNMPSRTAPSARATPKSPAVCRMCFTPLILQLAGGPGLAVGFALYYFPHLSFRGRPSMWLDDLYVHPPARRQGAGRLLMRRLAEFATAADCTHIAWVGSASNSIGMDFYRRLGASVVHQAEDAVTLQIEPATLLEAIAPPKKAP